MRARSSNALVAATTGLIGRAHVRRLLGEDTTVSVARRLAALARGEAMRDPVRSTDYTRFPDQTWRSHDTASPDSTLVYRHETAR